MIRNVNTDLIAGALGLILTLGFWFSIDPEIMRLSIMFPKAMIGIMGFFSVALTIRGFTKTAQRSDIFNVGSNRRAFITALLFFAWGIGINYLGFFTGSVLSILALVMYLALARRSVSLKTFLLWVVIVFGEVTFFYLVFTRLLHVPLPEGWFL